MIVVWFSCGAASAVAAKLTIERYGKENVRVVNNPVMEEDEDNRRFLKDVEKWLGIEIEFATNDKYPSCSAVDVWEKRRYMSHPKGGAPCTVELKKLARQQFEARNPMHAAVLGFTLDEEHRHKRFVRNERYIIPVLIRAKITKEDCFRILREAGIELPRVYKMGYPNANCIGCVKATSPTYWNHVRKNHPEAFKERAEQSRDVGAKLARVKGKRIFLDELDPDAKGRSMKSMKNIECGIFCEEKF